MVELFGFSFWFCQAQPQFQLSPVPATQTFNSDQFPDTDPWSEQVSLTDAEFDDGLTQAVYNVVHDEISTLQPEAEVKSPQIQLSHTDSAAQRQKRVKFAPQRLIEQI